jgi:hypothetical protein
VDANRDAEVIMVLDEVRSQNLASVARNGQKGVDV